MWEGGYRGARKDCLGKAGDGLLVLLGGGKDGGVGDLIGLLS